MGHFTCSTFGIFTCLPDWIGKRQKYVPNLQYSGISVMSERGQSCLEAVSMPSMRLFCRGFEALPLPSSLHALRFSQIQIYHYESQFSLCSNQKLVERSMHFEKIKHSFLLHLKLHRNLNSLCTR